MQTVIVIWDVNHGNSAAIRLPNGQVIMIDCAKNPETTFSPITKTRKRWGRINHLIISHPHIDHISDIARIDRQRPETLMAPIISTPILMEGKYEQYKRTMERYLNFASTYDHAPKRHHTSTKDSGANITNFWLRGRHDDINDHSIITFLEFGGFVLLFGGDLTSDGWRALAKQEGRALNSLLSRTNFFQASHHGRREGYNSSILNRMRKLQLVLVSDKKSQSTSVTNRYSEYCSGWDVFNEVSKEYKRRKVLTTRNDGRIRIRISNSYDRVKATIGVYPF